jgi:hypothetical protein
MAQYRTVPTYTSAWTPGNKNDSTWYRYFQAAEQGEAPSAEIPLKPGPSPFIYTAPKKGFMVVSGGTVTAIAIARTSPTYYATGETAGVFPMAQNDLLRVTYTGIPVMTFFPT